MTKVEELKKMYENMGGDPEAVADKTLITEMLDAMSELELSGLPDVTADDNGDVLTVVDGAWAKKSIDSGAKIINFEISTSGSAVVLSDGKTVGDVKNEIDNGNIVRLVMNGKIFNLGHINTQFMIFTSVMPDDISNLTDLYYRQITFDPRTSANNRGSFYYFKIAKYT